ncbi:MAG: Lrp/AsnC family transcriptional regulator [Nitrospirae bacterium]|nr:Lrp/AsnC family transcriptional regulator [Nitrospirota bacterium]
MDELDKEILKEIQDNFPLSSRPFKVLGEKFGRSEEEVEERIKKLKREKIISRLGASFASKKVGYESTLVAMKVPPPALEKIANFISCYPEVTHNYERGDDYNLWFTLIAPSKEEIKRILEEIKAKPEIEDVLNLPAINIFKIDVRFHFR